MTPKAILSLKVPYTLTREISKVLLLTSIGTALTALPGWAVTVAPTTITVRVPANSTNQQAAGTRTYTGTGGTSGASSALASNPAQTAATAFVDDVILQSVTFGNTTLSNLVPSLSSSRTDGALVTAGRDRISATYGDSDTNTDGNPNPFVNSGNGTIAYSNPPNQTPSVQDPAIQAAYSSLSLSEGISSPGQGGATGDYTFRLLFANGIVDGSSAVDNVPELIIFERGTAATPASGTTAATPGTQSDYTVQAIIGGTLNNPVFAPTTVTVLRANQTPSGIFINTVDSTPAEQINVAGIDLNEFGITDPNQAIYGISFTSINGSGADIFGLGLTAASSSQLRSQAVPEPSAILGYAIGGLFMGFLALKHQAKKEQLKNM